MVASLLLLALAQGPLDARFERVTRPLLGAPYAESPLGEGQGVDADPRFRLDAFDCTTFVETALALATETEDPEGVLDTIRYREGRPHFEARRHLVLSGWIPELMQDGWLSPTPELPRSRVIRFRLGPARWRARTIARALELPESAIRFGTFPVRVVPLDAVEPATLPTPAVLDLVRVDWFKSPELVTHQGLLLRLEGGQVVLRHASTRARRVVDEPLELALARWGRQKRRWPIAGVSLHPIRSERFGLPPARGEPPARPSPPAPEPVDVVHEDAAGRPASERRRSHPER